MKKDPRILVLKLATVALVLVYLVIAAGAVVRATGSGMGCPDWPKCFGHLIPSTDSSSLPEGYRKLYVEKRKAKNERMASLLRFFGADELAQKILDDPSIYTELGFNAKKAWIEYVNRLLGVLLGLVQFILVIAAWMYRKQNAKIFWFSILAILLTILEGWLGSLVVSTNLLPGTITIHMFLALGIMVLMTSIIVKLKNAAAGRSAPLIKKIIFFAVILSLAQIYMGTRVREQVDMIATHFDNRSEWIGALDHYFDLHRIMALAVLVLNGSIFYKLRKCEGELKYFSRSLICVVIFEMIAGFSLSFFSLPALVQPVHLILAVMMFGAQVSLVYRFRSQW